MAFGRGLCLDFRERHSGVTDIKTDVAIIGAGAAGLAAARRLHERGIDALVLEARDRIGGRAFTLQATGESAPVELGAEFIHGTPHVTLSLMHECGEKAVDVPTHAFQFRNGRFEERSDMWESAERLLQRVDPSAPDQSVEDFLNALPAGQATADQLDTVRTIVEGFEAADTADASVIAIANEWLGGSERGSLRPVNGYAPLMACLARIGEARILLETTVHEIRWSPHSVRILTTTEDGPLEVLARRTIITLPIGVLRAQGVSFTPPLPRATQRAIDAMTMGPVIRVVLGFRSPFWEYVEEGRYREAAFFYAPQRRLPAIWTRLPQRASFLVAWAGGGAVQRIVAERLDPIEAALRTCEAIFPSVDVREELREVYHHDWQADPFARGAYSYLRVGAGDARDVLATPVEETLYFAGEATSNTEPGTVAGALESGYHAADQITGSESGRQPST